MNKPTLLNEADKNFIGACARKYDVSTIYLFGSSLHGSEQARDIDLGVKGINPALFFKFYGELMRHLSKPVDLVDLSRKTLFNALVEERGAKFMDELLREIAAEKERVEATLSALEKTLRRSYGSALR